MQVRPPLPPSPLFPPTFPSHLLLLHTLFIVFFSVLGKLILTSVNTVLVSPQQTQDVATNRKAYEAEILQKETFNYDGKGKDYIYLCLPPT